MLTRNLLRSNYYHGFKYIGLNSYNWNSFKIVNHSSRFIGGNKRHYCLHRQNALTSKSVNCQRFITLQNSLRYLNTESSTTAAAATTTTKEETTQEATKKIVPLTRGETLKKAVKEYGSTVIVFHVGISLVSLGSCYLLVTSGLDFNKVFSVLRLDEWIAKSQIAANAGTFAVAYAIHKVLMPVRITITLTSVPLIVRYLRRVGFLKK